MDMCHSSDDHQPQFQSSTRIDTLKYVHVCMPIRASPTGTARHRSVGKSRGKSAVQFVPLPQMQCKRSERCACATDDILAVVILSKLLRGIAFPVTTWWSLSFPCIAVPCAVWPVSMHYKCDALVLSGMCSLLRMLLGFLGVLFCLLTCFLLFAVLPALLPLSL